MSITVRSANHAVSATALFVIEIPAGLVATDPDPVFETMRRYDVVGIGSKVTDALCAAVIGTTQSLDVTDVALHAPPQVMMR